MYRKLRWLLLLIFLATVPGSHGQDRRGVGTRPAMANQRLALVIGNAAYDPAIGRLVNPVNDATDMAAALQRLGFDLVGGKAQLNLNKWDMLTLIRQFGEQIRDGGIGFFYFSGHGVQVDKRNFLIPITDAIAYEDDAERKGVDVDTIAKAMERAENRLNILVLDACRNNRLAKRERGSEKGLAEPSHKPEGTLIAFAASDGQTASENSAGRNGLFTQELLRNLEAPGSRLDDVFRLTRNDVKRLSGGSQVPMVSDSTSEAVVLKSLNTETVASSSSTWTGLRNMARALAKYDYVAPFADGLAGVTLNGKHGYINVSGQLVTPVKYSSAFPVSEGLAAVELEGKWSFVDTAGHEKFPFKYDELYPFAEGLAAVKLGEKWGFIDKTGRMIIPVKYDEVNQPSEGLIAVKLNEKYGYIDKTGRVLIPFKYDDAQSFSEGLAGVGVDQTHQLINRSGEVVRITQYAILGVFSGGFVMVGEEDEARSETTADGGFFTPFNIGFMNRSGSVVVPVEYHEAKAFSEGFAVVAKDGKQGIVDATGHEIVPLKYDVDPCGCELSAFSNGLAQVILNGKYGFVDTTGREVIKPKYDEVWCDAFRKDGMIGVTLNGKKGFVDIYGNEYFDF